MVNNTTPGAPKYCSIFSPPGLLMLWGTTKVKANLTDPTGPQTFKHQIFGFSWVWGYWLFALLFLEASICLPRAIGIPNLKSLLSSSFVSVQMPPLVTTALNHTLLFPPLLSSCASRAAPHYITLLYMLLYFTASALWLAVWLHPRGSS